MKSAIIYYSLTGDVDFISREIKKNLSCDLIRLKPIKDVPANRLKALIPGGHQVLKGEQPKLSNKKINLKKYDALFIGTPIWVGTFAPTINTFLHQYKIENKKIILFCGHGGGGNSRCFSNIKKLIPNNTFISEFEIKSAQKNKEKTIEIIEKEIKVIKNSINI